MTVMVMCSDFVLSCVMVSGSSVGGVVGEETECRLELRVDDQYASSEDGLVLDELSADEAVATVVDTHRAHVHAQCLSVPYHLQKEKIEIEAIITS